MFSFMISTLYIIDVRYVQFWLKRIVEYQWKNSEHILKLLCSLKESWNVDHIFCLFRIIQNLGNKGTIILLKKLCEYNLHI